MSIRVNSVFGIDRIAVENWNEIHPEHNTREEALAYISGVRETNDSLYHHYTDAEDIFRNLVARNQTSGGFLPVYDRDEWEDASLLGLPVELVERPSRQEQINWEEIEAI